MEKLEQQRPQWLEDTTKESYPPEGRSLEEYEKFLGFCKEELAGKTILDLGSGPTERLSREIKENEVDANVISLNPDYKSEKYRKEVVNNSDWQKKSVAAIAQELPFKDKSFDEVLGLYSVSWYIENVDTEFGQVLQEIFRVLKPGGIARIGPFTTDRLPKNLIKKWRNILPRVELYTEETDEWYQEEVLLRLVLKKVG